MMLLLALWAGVTVAMRPASTVRVVDAKTRNKVTLVGAMHYNPVSIALARDTVAHHDGALGAVVIESCLSRWNRTLVTSPDGSFSARYVLPSEMRAAALEAARMNVPLNLGDTDAGDLGPRVGEMLAETARDLVTPQGWKRIVDDLIRGGSLAFDARELEESLGLGDTLRPALLAGAAVSAVRYPLAFFLKAPVKSTAFFSSYIALGGALDTLAATADDLSVDTPELAAVGAGLLFFNVLFPLVSARLLLVVLLEERNLRIARSIRDAASRGPVVAILGALHVNGVAKLLLNTEGEIVGNDGDRRVGVWWPPADL